MTRAGRITLLVALCALLLPASAGAASKGLGELWWLGPYFAGMRITGAPEETGETYVYGECELPEGEGGCSPPAQVQTDTSCERNPIALDVLPARVYLLRGGGLAADYGSMVDIGSGRQTVTLFADHELVGAALEEIRPRSQPEPQPLAPAVYPLPVLREVVRVTAVADRYDSARALAEATKLTPDEVRLRLRIAELLGPEALAGVRPPTMSIKTVERLRQLGFLVDEEPARTARKLGVSVAALKKKLRPIRGLAPGTC
ncbi:MAG TPA: hypothetical protein VF255_02020 [Solirubrobacterales bacterium]